MDIHWLCEKAYEDLNGRFSVVAQDDGVSVLDYQCDCWECGVTRLFRLTCRGVVESDLRCRHAEEIAFDEEHPLLWPYNCDHAYLHFSSPADNPLEVLGLLYMTHEHLYQGWRPFRELANEMLVREPIELLGSHSGLIATGPRHVVEAFQKAIGDRQRTAVIDAHRSRDSKSVLVLDESYVVCDSVEMEEKEQPAGGRC